MPFEAGTKLMLVNEYPKKFFQIFIVADDFKISNDSKIHTFDVQKLYMSDSDIPKILRNFIIGLHVTAIGNYKRKDFEYVLTEGKSRILFPSDILTPLSKDEYVSAHFKLAQDHTKDLESIFSWTPLKDKRTTKFTLDLEFVV